MRIVIFIFISLSVVFSGIHAVTAAEGWWRPFRQGFMGLAIDGAWEDWRDDAKDFPLDVLGNTYDSWPVARFTRTWGFCPLSRRIAAFAAIRAYHNQMIPFNHDRL